MRNIVYITFSVCLALVACANRPQHDRPYVDKRAIQLNDSAVTMSLFGDTAKVMAAIELLNEATNIQPDYYMAYENKLQLQYRCGHVDDAISTLKTLEQLRPQEPGNKVSLGLLYEKYKGDTAKAMIKYKEANILYRAILDTINTDASTYPERILSYVCNLKLLRMDKEADNVASSFITTYHNENNDLDKGLKKQMRNMGIGKTRKGLVDGSLFGK